MAAATRSRKSTQDDRKPNEQPNTMPAGIRLVVKLASNPLFAITLRQNDKLSPSGKVTYHAAIKDGWELPGTWMDTLAKVGFEADGDELTIAGSGVHQSESGNPTVCHTVRLELPTTDAEPVPYMLQVYATYLVKKGSYQLSARANPALIGAARGPQVIGAIEMLSAAGEATTMKVAIPA